MRTSAKSDAGGASVTAAATAATHRALHRSGRRRAWHSVAPRTSKRDGSTRATSTEFICTFFQRDNRRLRKRRRRFGADDPSSPRPLSHCWTNDRRVGDIPLIPSPPPPSFFAHHPPPAHALVAKFAQHPLYRHRQLRPILSTQARKQTTTLTLRSQSERSWRSLSD